jgi:hypothetical protein
VEPTFARTTAVLDAVPTADPRLLDGREAWHRVQRMYARIAALEPERRCSVQRDYVRRDFNPTRALRSAQKMFRVAMRWDAAWIDCAMAKAIKRMLALGVTPEQADGFDGELEPASKPEDGSQGNGKRDGNGKGRKARAAQAPAPSSPLASPIAAR